MGVCWCLADDVINHVDTEQKRMNRDKQRQRIGRNLYTLENVAADDDDDERKCYVHRQIKGIHSII